MPDISDLHVMIPPIWQRPSTPTEWDRERMELGKITTILNPMIDIKRRLLITLFVAGALAVLVGGEASALWVALSVFSACALVGLGMRNRLARADVACLRLTSLQPAQVTDFTVHAFAHSPKLWSELAALQKTPVPLLQGDLENLMNRLWQSPDETVQMHIQSLPGEREESLHLWRSVVFSTGAVVLGAAALMAVCQLGRFH